MHLYRMNSLLYGRPEIYSLSSSKSNVSSRDLKQTILFESCAIAGSLFQIVGAALLKALAPHAVCVLGTYNSCLDDERSETVELITVG